MEIVGNIMGAVIAPPDLWVLALDATTPGLVKTHPKVVQTILIVSCAKESAEVVEARERCVLRLHDEAVVYFGQEHWMRLVRNGE
jgi:hypothetical protein